MLRHIAITVALTLLASPSLVMLLTNEQAKNQSRVLEQLKTSVAAHATDAGKFALIKQTMTDNPGAEEPDVALRRLVLKIATGIAGTELETFLIDRLTSEEDAGLRSQVATELGQKGSESCFAALAKVAASDRITSVQMGCMRGRSSARRAGIFAVAELARRFPKLADQAASDLRAIHIDADPKDNESLADARRQALYQITRDPALLRPFFDQLKSADPKERDRGLAAFGLLKLTVAPREVVKALGDPNIGNRCSAAMVLGEIRDPTTVEPLIGAATDAKMDRSVRCNAIWALGEMRAGAAADSVEKLVADPDVSASAAIALYRISGKKVKQFPQGYNAD